MKVTVEFFEKDVDFFAVRLLVYENFNRFLTGATETETT